MKRNFIVLFFFGIIGLNNLSLAQRKVTLVKLSLQHFFASTVKLSIERGISQSISVYLNPAYTLINRRFEHALGPGLEIGCKKYFIPENEALTGFYINGNLSFQYFDAEYKKHSRYTSYGIPYTISDSVFIQESIHRWGGAITLGYQFNSGKFYMDFFAGLDYKTGNSSLGEDSNFRNNSWRHVYSRSAFIPKFGILTGIRIN